jgi:hypothetical protein
MRQDIYNGRRDRSRRFCRVILVLASPRSIEDAFLTQPCQATQKAISDRSIAEFFVKKKRQTPSQQQAFQSPARNNPTADISAGPRH